MVEAARGPSAGEHVTTSICAELDMGELSKTQRGGSTESREGNMTWLIWGKASYPGPTRANPTPKEFLKAGELGQG